ncbi:branched-chain amino acid ABC transporter substrate-binding protein [Nocardia transvalensis]|nr:branched-chain amino acid ABC transporter substrate-binding protein [Nocardia transvalensis]
MLAVTGCGSKTTEGGGGGTGGADSALKIRPVVQIDSEGKEVPATDTSAAADPAGDGKAKCGPLTIAMSGPLTGPNANLGLNIVRGVKLALDQHNKANPECQVKLREFDTEGDSQKASQVVPAIIGDPSIVALIGPTFSGEVNATGQSTSDAGLLSLTASATNVNLTKNGWRTFFRGLGNDGLQGPAVAKYLMQTGKYKKICVVAENTDYATGLAKSVADTLGPGVADPSCAANIKQGDKDFSATVSKLAAAKPDAIYYAGYYGDASPFAQQLRSGGVTSTFISDDGVRDIEFVRQAGNASKGAILSCPCGPEPEKFTADYKALNGYEPGTYSVEGYDLTTIVLKAIDAGKVSRADIVEHVRNYDGQGLARRYKWDATGELQNALIWMYEVK